MERVRGIEPPSLAWEARALPLSYTRGASDYRRGRSEPIQPHEQNAIPRAVVFGLIVLTFACGRVKRALRSGNVDAARKLLEDPGGGQGSAGAGIPLRGRDKRHRVSSLDCAATTGYREAP